MEAVLEPWLETEEDDATREAVLYKLIWISENIETISRWAAIPGQNPLRRSIEIDEGVVIEFILATPSLGARLLRIETIT